MSLNTNHCFYYCLRFQSRIVLSSLLLASVNPSGENEKDLIKSVCPSSVVRRMPVSASHKCIVLSFPRVANVFPFGDNLAANQPLGCCVIVVWRVPVSTSHSSIVLSCLRVANVFPSQENSTILLFGFPFSVVGRPLFSYSTVEFSHQNFSHQALDDLEKM